MVTFFCIALWLFYQLFKLYRDYDFKHYNVTGGSLAFR